MPGPIRKWKPRRRLRHFCNGQVLSQHEAEEQIAQGAFVITAIPKTPGQGAAVPLPYFVFAQRPERVEARNAEHVVSSPTEAAAIVYGMGLAVKRCGLSRLKVGDYWHIVKTDEFRAVARTLREQRDEDASLG